MSDAAPSSSQPTDETRTLITSTHWRCEKCRGCCYLLVERGEERLSWCAVCYDDQGEKR